MTRSGTGAGRDGLIGIDLGTGSVKVVVTDAVGRVLTHAETGYDVIHPRPGWAESDPQEWLRATADALREAITAAGVRPVAVGLSGQMHGVVVVDRRGRPCRPAVLWSDSRATDQAETYRSLPDEVLARLGNPIVPGMAGPILGWLVRNEPEHLREARWFLQPKDWLRLQLTGEVHTEPSDASATLLYDIGRDRWDPQVVDVLSIEADRLPPMLPSSVAHAGNVTTKASDLTGLPAGTPVAAGAADTAAALVGTGSVEPGTTQLTIGTGIQVVAVLDAVPAPLPLHPVTHTYRTAQATGWYSMAASLNGGSTLAWVRHVLGMSWTEMYDAAGLAPRPDDPCFLPHLHGERTPWLDPTMGGAWTDLNPRHDRARLARAALEGVAMATKACLDSLPVAVGCGTTPLRLAGGGTVHPSWRQMLADILGRPLEAVDINAASGRGAALLGGSSLGGTPMESPPAPGEVVVHPAPEATDWVSERERHALRRIRELRDGPE